MFDGPDHANHVLNRLLEVVEGLVEFPERGSYPKELMALGIKDYRQTGFKPYRVIYRVLGDRVVIYLIADGRRDMQSVLARRLLGA
ncbi:MULTISPECIES: type II toxin-antitoxin system RelE/ParE family toxin [unclassified Ectothiorhodospira]|uniref:type II toxin-antitoxin system RelE/ParE family toxin n=1 Tax=unclassified Ectothiorhodospira TaxID=2684909 RepID=UPI001EE990AB|nr:MULTISPECIES: type II toxin-antitoxin system RelE/ParE family toxin [unclassified Ectothiorhodospira]MCG5515837.1 type II toxin-antitoxin system RelE/ParE family toxin [Ectothiorhodospira sp. 9100]MCG5518923.1 type II toxin-antitoxin system RelE/ParE family toxin [Ectothiorhodospira sp. 9905]